jgi:phage terminase Nu1 subunit (DNA packaging protein)
MATQEQIAEHLDLSKRRVQDLMVEGVLQKGADLDQCRVNYIRYLRSNAAGQHTGAAPSLADGRARLVKLQGDKVELELAELRGEVVRADDVAKVMQAHIMDLPFFWVYVGINVALTLTGVFTVDPSLQQDSASRSQTAPRSANRSLPVRAEDSAQDLRSALDRNRARCRSRSLRSHRARLAANQRVTTTP